MHQKGIIALGVPVFIFLTLAIVLILVSLGVIKNPLKSLVPTNKEPTVSLQTKYENPFDPNAQYVNPFNSYKNPFDNLK